MGFEIGVIRAGREQVDGDVMCSVASYWKVEPENLQSLWRGGKTSTALNGDILVSVIVDRMSISAARLLLDSWPASMPSTRTVRDWAKRT